MIMEIGDAKSVCLKVGQSKSNEVCTILEQPAMKIVLLLEQEVWFPDKEQWIKNILR